jgi:hypothetical protein
MSVPESFRQRVVRFMLSLRVARLLLVVMLFVVGCGESESSKPKTDLSDKEKQQIRELNEQRASEWASTKRK